MDENWLVYINGNIVPLQEAKLSVFDRGFQYGDGVFEGLRCYERRIFKLREHTDRLFRSAEAIGITMSMTKDAFNEAVKLTVRANGFANAHVRPQVTRGYAWKLGLDPRNTTAANVVIIVRPIGKSMFDAESGLRLASVSVRKIPPACLDPRVKSCNYLVNILARAEAIASGADEAIMLDLFGHVSEGAGDNLFLVRQGELYTPMVQDALEGITRGTILDLADHLMLRVHETHLTMYDVYTADEVFVCGSGAGIMPVTEIDRRPVSAGRMGPLTRRLAEAYDEAARNGEAV